MIRTRRNTSTTATAKVSTACSSRRTSHPLTGSVRLPRRAAGAGQGQLCYFVFDLLHLDGQDLTGATLEARKQALEALVGSAGDNAIRYSKHVRGQGAEFFQQACRRGLEGVDAKRRDAPYEPGRGRSWLKIKCIKEQEFVIGGFTEPKGSRSGLGALLLGVTAEDGRLAYAGKVGTGFTGRAAVDLRQRLDQIRAAQCPFRARPPGAGQARWVAPVMVAEVEFSEWTNDGRLRHPSFKGIREDKAAAEIVRERPAEPPPTPSPASPAPRPATRRSTRGRELPASGDGDATVAGVRISHPDRVVYPDDGITKIRVARYFAAVALFTALGSAEYVPPMAAAWAPNGLFALAGVYFMLHVRT